MIDMKVNIAGVSLKNPVITASGTFGFGEEYMGYMDLSALGAITLKALTKEKRLGNPPVRIAETSSGVLNSVGLQNPGVEEFKKTIWQRIKTINTVKIANIAGSTVEDYIYVTEALNEIDIDLYEINVSCPNVSCGGIGFGTDAEVLKGIVSKVKKVAKKPIIIKLTPNVTNILDMAKAAKEGGADGISLINTLTGMAINAQTSTFVLANKTGGLSGPCIKPIALRMVYEVRNIDIDIIGMGGIMSGEDCAEFMIAGANAVMVGSATMRKPTACIDIINELTAFGEDRGLESISQLTNTIKEN